MKKVTIRMNTYRGGFIKETDFFEVMHSDYLVGITNDFMIVSLPY